MDMSFLDQEILWGISTWRLMVAGIIIFAGFASRSIIQMLFRGVFKKYAGKTEAQWDDELIQFVPAPLAAIVQIGIWHIAAGLLEIPNDPVELQTYIFQGLQVAMWAAVGWLMMRLVDVLSGAMARASAKTESKIDDQFVPLLRKTLKVIIFITIVLMVIQNLGYSVTSLIASLGIGGLAMALAAQDTVANLFGSVVVFTDKPFMIGDWVEFDGVEGTIEEVGFRTTKVRRFDKSQVTVPNAKFSTSPIVNHSRRPIRRINMNVGVTYETSAAQMKALLADLRELVANHPGLDQGFHFVHFTEFGDSSLNIQFYCFTKSSVWTDFLAVREDLMFQVMEVVEKHGLEMAFPTRTVYLRGEGTPQVMTPVP
ncbi:MAG TPA: mechanosensitive ion channel family protein [Calditrichia bacterium]|nr:mechanosensitive ion channel family protein [Calditrichia bacterium]